MYPRLYLTKLAFGYEANMLGHTLYKFGLATTNDKREVSSKVIKRYGWCAAITRLSACMHPCADRRWPERRTESTVFDFHLDAPGDLMLGDSVCMLTAMTEKEVKRILEPYCWREAHMRVFNMSDDGYTETYILPGKAAACLKAFLPGITSRLQEHAAVIRESQKALLVAHKEQAYLKDLAMKLCIPLKECMRRSSMTPPPPLEPALDKLGQQFSFGFGISELMNELKQDNIISNTPIGTALQILSSHTQNAERTASTMPVVYQSAGTASADPPSSKAAFSATAHCGGTLLPSKPPRLSQGAAARASLGSAVPMPSAHMPRMSDGALPRVFAGLRVSAGAAAHVPPRVPRQSGSVPGVFPLAPAMSVYR